MVRRVEAFVTAIGFPKDLHDLDAMVRKNIDHGEPHPALLDLDLIVSGRWKSVGWSVPPWAQPGDIAIFYCTQRSTSSARALRRLIETVEIEIDDSDETEVEELREAYKQILDHAAGQTQKHSAAFVGIGRVVSMPSDGSGAHFRDRLFADIEDIVSFPEPVSAARISEVFQVRRAATITRMGGLAYGEFVRTAADQLPVWAREARIGLDAYPGLDWRELVTDGDWRPHTEDEFREFVATPLLREVAGSDDGVMAECRTMRRGRWTGFVDNLVNIDGAWTAVECKLRISSEAAMIRQAGQYIGCTKAVATLGPLKGSQMKLVRSTTCWVLDSFGLYLVDRQGFVGCSPDAPLHSISELASMSGSEVAGLLRSTADSR